MPPSLFATKNADAKSTYIGSAKSFSTRDAYINNICARGTYAENAFSAVSVCINSTSPDSTCIEGANRKNACAGSACTVKHSRIYLQSFLISEMKLFDTS